MTPNPLIQFLDGKSYTYQGHEGTFTRIVRYHRHGRYIEHIRFTPSLGSDTTAEDYTFTIPHDGHTLQHFARELGYQFPP